MELDFSKINNIHIPEKRQNKPYFDDNKDNLTMLQLQAEETRKEKERMLKVYADHQTNRMKTAKIQTDIIQGIHEGENIYKLFLKAIQAISLMTGTSVFEDQAKGDLITIYGAGLCYDKPLEIDLEETEKRLEKLKEALRRGTEPEDSIKRIKTAIQAHESRVKQIKKKLSQKQDGEI